MNNGLWNYAGFNVRPPTPDKLVESEAEDSGDSDDDRVFFRKKSSHKRRFDSPTTSDEEFIDDDDHYDDDSSYHLAWNQKKEEDDLKRRQEKAITSMNWEAKHKMSRHSPPATQDSSSSVDMAKNVAYYQQILQPPKKKKAPQKPEAWRAEKARERAKTRSAKRMVSPSSRARLQPYVKRKKIFGTRKKKKVSKKKIIEIPEYKSYTMNPYGEDPYAQYDVDGDDTGGSSKNFINVT